MKAFMLLALVATVYGTALYKDEFTRDLIPNEYIVQLNPNISLIEANLHIAVVKADVDIKVHRMFRIGTFTAYHMTAPKVSMERLLLDPTISHIEPNQVMRAFQQCTEQFGATWGIVRTVNKDLDLTGLYPHEAQDGEGVDAYIIDTGIYTEHNDFNSRAVWGTDTVDTPSPETDGNGHGTHVAGTVMSDTYGLARSATAVAVKVLSAGGSGSTAGVVQGIEWVTKQHQSKKGRSVANMSLGGGLSTAMNSAVDQSSAAGVTHVVAAGNENQDACRVSPASAESAITVACSNNKDQRCSFSNYGTCVQIIAPGQDITSTWKDGPFSDNTISGTSMSAPHVAGIAAKILSAADDVMSPAQVLASLQDLANKDKITLLPTSPATPNLLVYADCPFSNNVE